MVKSQGSGIGGQGQYQGSIRDPGSVQPKTIRLAAASLSGGSNKDPGSVQRVILQDQL